jgi:putative phage-type endonuclease
MIYNRGDCKVLATYADLSETEWLELRENTIGGSDAAAIMAPKFDTPVTLYLKKKGLMKDENSAYMECGKWMEKPIKERFEREMVASGFAVVVKDSSAVYESKKYPGMTANIDGFVFFDGELCAGLEVKDCSVYLKNEWEDGKTPARVYAQCQHYMLVTGLHAFWVAAFVRPNLEIRRITRDDEYINGMIEKELWFFQCLMNNEMPAPCGLEVETKALANLYSNHTDEMIDLPGMALWIRDYDEICKREKAVKTQKEILKTMFRQKIGKNKGLRSGFREVCICEYEKKYFNHEKFKQDFPDLWEKYYEGRKESRLYVK